MTAQLSPPPRYRAVDSNGAPLAFGVLTTYAAGTTDLQATYIDSTQTTQNTNPITLNAMGECALWLDPSLTYKFNLTDNLGNQVPGYPVDNIPGGFGALPISVSLIPNPTNIWTLGNSTHSWAQIYLGANAAPAYDPVSGNIGYYARTAAEIAAGVTPTNYVYAPGVVDRYGTNATPGTTDMWPAVIAAQRCNSYVRGIPGSTYNFATASPTSCITASNFTLDMTGCTIVSTASASDANALICIGPQSLVTSGRFAGTDYPSNWKNGSTPEPTDGDFNVMMHENVVANRQVNVTLLGLKSTAAITGVRAWSIDGITFRDCNLSMSTWSNVRLFHCTAINADFSNRFGGSGTYALFGLKCGNGIDIKADFNTQGLSANGRLCSFKGALHTPVTTSIFVASAAICDMSANIGGSFFSNLDCLAFDSAPDLTADCNSAAQGGAGTGVLKGVWYGSGDNFKAIGGSYLTTATVTATHENSVGRAFFSSDPHVNVHFDNNQCNNATVAISGVDGASICDNEINGTTTGYSIVVNPTGNNPATTTTRATVKNNVDIGWRQVSGSSVASIMQIGGNYHAITGNCSYNPGSGLSGMIGQDTCDYTIFEDNTLSYSTPSPTFVVSIDSNNAHGQQWNNNKMINTATGAVAYSNFQGSTSGAIPDGGTVGHSLYHAPSSVVVAGSISGTIVDVTAVSSINFTVSLKTISGGSIVSAPGQAVYFWARV